MELDALDRKILIVLGRNGRAGIKHIARKVRSSPEVVRYRLARLEKQGVIRRHMALVNFSELGFIGYGVFCCFESEEGRKAALEFLKAHQRVYWMADFGGRFDLAFAVMARNDFEFYSIFSQIKEKARGALGGWEVAIRMELSQLPRDYLVGGARKTNAQTPYFGRELGKQSLDKADFSILKTISQNARAETVAIAKKVSMPASTVAFRLKKLKERGILQGATPQVECQKYGYQCFQFFLEVKGMDENRRRKVCAYAQANPNVVFLVETLGSWNFEMICEVHNQKDFQRQMAALRSAFPWLRKIESAIIFDHNVKYNLFPLEKKDKQINEMRGGATLE